MNKPDGVVLLHGLALRGWVMSFLAWRLRREGYRVLTITYPSRKLKLLDIADHVAPKVAAFAQTVEIVHFAGHSLGGLVIRALMIHHRPPNAGRVVMIGTPNHGSEIADRLKDNWLFKKFFGPVGQELTTAHDYDAIFGMVDYPLCVIAGSMSIGPLAWLWDMPKPHDGKVTVASTHAAGEALHVTLPVSHTVMPLLPSVIEKTVFFIQRLTY